MQIVVQSKDQWHFRKLYENNTLKIYLLFVTENVFSFLILNYFVLLTIFTEVIHNNNST